MANDPIRRAVEAAAEVLQRNMERFHGACPDDYEAVDHAERVIAAFLRALPYEPHRSDMVGRCSIEPDVREDLAAAVLAAGKGDGDGQ